MFPPAMHLVTALLAKINLTLAPVLLLAQEEEGGGAADAVAWGLLLLALVGGTYAAVFRQDKREHDVRRSKRER